jgi:hypothetical protein
VRRPFISFLDDVKMSKSTLPASADFAKKSIYRACCVLTLHGMPSDEAQDVGDKVVGLTVSLALVQLFLIYMEKWCGRLDLA